MLLSNVDVLLHVNPTHHLVPFEGQIRHGGGEATWVRRHVAAPCPHLSDGTSVWKPSLPTHVGSGGLFVTLNAVCWKGSALHYLSRLCCLQCFSPSWPPGLYVSQVGRKALQTFLRGDCVLAKEAFSGSHQLKRLSWWDSRCKGPHSDVFLAVT